MADAPQRASGAVLEPAAPKLNLAKLRGLARPGFDPKTFVRSFSPAEVIPPAELPDAEYPYVLITGRTLQHWHGGSMTRRARVLDALEPEAFCEMNPADLARLGISAGDMVLVTSRRNSVRIRARSSDKTSLGGVFIPFHFREAAANLLTNDVLDPVGKIPEFKFSAVKVTKA